MHHNDIDLSIYVIGTYLLTLVSFASFLTVLSNLTLKKMCNNVNTETGMMIGGETGNNVVVKTEKKMLRGF